MAVAAEHAAATPLVEPLLDVGLLVCVAVSAHHWLLHQLVGDRAEEHLGRRVGVDGRNRQVGGLGAAHVAQRSAAIVRRGACLLACGGLARI